MHPNHKGVRGMRKLLWIVILGASGWAFAATPFKQSLTNKRDNYLTHGVFTGGKAGLGSSLLAVRHQFSKKTNFERVVVELGDKNANPAGENMGFFQASLDPVQKRLVLNISQLRLSKVSELQVRQLFKRSPYVQSVDFTLDPEDKMATMVLNMKKPVQLEVFHKMQDGKPAQIVMDIAAVRSKRR